MLPEAEAAEARAYCASFNGHPPLGVNATKEFLRLDSEEDKSFNGHPPLGVNATNGRPCSISHFGEVSMGTHPWG